MPAGGCQAHAGQLAASGEGRVVAIHCQVGDLVDAGAVLIELAEEPA